VWLVVHLYYLIGFENRVRVVLRWAYYYVRLDRPVRIIVRAEPAHPAAAVLGERIGRGQDT
jgi:NADH dehydrogenase